MFPKLVLSEDDDPKEVFKKVYDRALSLGLTDKDLTELDSIQFVKTPQSSTGGWRFWLSSAFVAFLACCATIYFKDWPFTREQVTFVWFEYALDRDIGRERCISDVPDIFNDLFRPPRNCDICKDMTEVDRVSGITPEEFEQKYAYSSRPVVIVDGAKDWTAPKVFSFKYFKNLYQEGSPALESTEAQCQYFPYKTEFKTLGDVFNMSEDRALMKDGSKPWYIGWSNCDHSVSGELRKHYQRPYFLPKVSESSKTDWVFMGSPGYGAPMHVDNVGHSSWQAQITGVKIWTLEPPRECYYQCSKKIEVPVHPGEIIVLNTDLWYHSTLVVGKEMSIVIGSEYD